jgi:hypothetical protein
MAEMKTKPTDSSVEAFLRGIDDPVRQKDCRALVAMLKKATREDATMWGPSIVGFGSYHYKYESGREGDMCAIGISPRKAALSLYLLGGLEPLKELLAKLGKYKTGKGCLYINKLADVDLDVLNAMFVQVMSRRKTE